MQTYDAEAVHAGLPYDRLVPALIEHHRRDVEAQASKMLEQPSAGGGGLVDNFLTLPAWQTGRAIGAKLITVFPHNEATSTGLPNVQGVYVLFSGTDGRPLAVIDGTALTLRKTAADSAVGAQFLARRDAKTLLMVGAGALAPHLAQAHLCVRPSIERVLVWNRTAQRAEAMAADLARPGLSVSATADLEGAARGADVISCATMATEPLIRGDWLKPGAHLDLVGSFRPDMHECDDEVFRRGSTFVDSPWSALNDSGEILAAIESGALTRDAILADNFAFARGTHPGRRSDHEITVYKNGGGGHLDLMVAQILSAL